ncbi:hypothetical protein PIB30_073733 [Stylosanthes scabra]|uniref:Uncharacterized protein n=1 Tax=Stylosanthes scabra TaxID=79078 RepID=A0ABU6ZN81_9FABA|nr:hypothetical protein [Stylosanthes scabra]
MIRINPSSCVLAPKILPFPEGNPTVRQPCKSFFSGTSFFSAAASAQPCFCACIVKPSLLAAIASASLQIASIAAFALRQRGDGNPSLIHFRLFASLYTPKSIIPYKDTCTPESLTPLTHESPASCESTTSSPSTLPERHRLLFFDHLLHHRRLGTTFFGRWWDSGELVLATKRRSPKTKNRQSVNRGQTAVLLEAFGKGLAGMASESSRGSRASRSIGSTHRTMLLCHHGERPVLRVSGTKENPGRRFWGCVCYAVSNLRLHSGFGESGFWGNLSDVVFFQVKEQ